MQIGFFENAPVVFHLFWLGPISAVIALMTAWWFFKDMMKSDSGTPMMQEIAKYVQEGAMAYLRQQYKVVSIVFLVLVLLFVFLSFGLGVQSKWVPIAFLTGGFFSGLCGFLGMKTATYASSKTAQAAQHSLGGALKIALRSGAVLGLSVVGFGLLDISLWFILLRIVLKIDLQTVALTMLSFGIGASTQALFARVGGGIFTKSADVGADLVGKIEAGIPEDDPRNPAVIADNVGDNVGDVAGMGADLYESYCSSILATAAIGSSAALHFSSQVTDQIALLLVILPIIIAGIGAFLSIFGILTIRIKESATQRDLLNALSGGIRLGSLLITVGSGLVTYFLFKDVLSGIIGGWMGIWFSIVVGLLTGIIIGKATEYYTSAEFRHTKEISEQSKTGAATVIIAGIGKGMSSVWIPILTVSGATVLTYWLAGGFTNAYMGLYGIGIASVGMLSTLGLTLATDAYGPIADNAGGNAEMCHLSKEVRKRTDALDSLGNTTAATGKGFAIGSAALTALALISSYIEEVHAALMHNGVQILEIGGQIIDIKTATIEHIINYYHVHLMNPNVLVGIFVGVMLTFIFSSMTMGAVGRAAYSMVEEVRRQFRVIPGLMEGKAKPEYATCVEIATKGAQREMIIPSLTAIIVPVLTGVILGVAGVIGLLVGGLVSGFAMAVFMANSGGAWDNAKKFIEAGNFGGKGSDCHKAAVIGDTVGDPFKDTCGPSLNILIKLMSMVSIVAAGVTVTFSLF